MSCITIGSIVENLRLQRKDISRKKLSEGLCSLQRLYDIEKDNCESDTLLVDILLQRLGKSPDKLERVLQADMYRMVRLRDLLEEAIMRGRKTHAERILESYPQQTKVDRMYVRRMRACMLYRIDHDLPGAGRQLQEAVRITLPGFTYETIENYLISTVEMENLLALERMRIEENPMREKEEEKRHLEILLGYIDRHFTDEEEHAKICSKCTWLLARVFFLKKDYASVLSLCKKGMEGLRRNNILYFMLPLLQLMTEAEKELFIDPEKSIWVKYYEILTFLWEGYAKKWYPTDALFHNCYQQEYHLDYELIRSEREARGMTQEELSEGIYQNVESYSRFETVKASPNKKTFEKLTGKLRIEKGRYNAYAVTDSFEVMDIRINLDLLISHSEYEKAEEELKRLERKLDMNVMENRMLVKDFKVVIDCRLGRISYEDALQQEIPLLNEVMNIEQNFFYHIPMRNEVLVIDHICLNLEKMGREEDAKILYEKTLKLLNNSMVAVKYRYRSYSLLLNNYVDIGMDYPIIFSVLKNELQCGKASILPFCLSNITRKLEHEKLKQDSLWWAKSVYYISDLFYFRKIKNMYAEYLMNEHKLTLAGL